MAAKCGCPPAWRFPFPGGPSGLSPTAEGVVPVDFNYDFKTDLVLAGAGGLRLLRQDTPNTFTDVTAPAKLPKSVANGHYTARGQSTSKRTAISTSYSAQKTALRQS